MPGPPSKPNPEPQNPDPKPKPRFSLQSVVEPVVSEVCFAAELEQDPWLLGHLCTILGDITLWEVLWDVRSLATVCVDSRGKFKGWRGGSHGRAAKVRGI